MATIKLTKKQQKAAAFRGKKGRAREEPQDVPVMEDLEMDDGFGQDAISVLPPKKATKPKENPSESPSKKRKREGDVIGTMNPPNKRVKLPAESTDVVKPKEKKQNTGPKYILFVGKDTSRKLDDSNCPQEI